MIKFMPYPTQRNVKVAQEKLTNKVGDVFLDYPIKTSVSEPVLGQIDQNSPQNGQNQIQPIRYPHLIS